MESTDEPKLTWEEREALDGFAEILGAASRANPAPPIDEEMVRRVVDFATEARERRVGSVPLSFTIICGAGLATAIFTIGASIPLLARTLLGISAGIMYAILVSSVLEADDLP